MRRESTDAILAERSVGRGKGREAEARKLPPQVKGGSREQRDTGRYAARERAPEGPVDGAGDGAETRKGARRAERPQDDARPNGTERAEEGEGARTLIVNGERPSGTECAEALGKGAERRPHGYAAFEIPKSLKNRLSAEAPRTGTTQIEWCRSHQLEPGTTLSAQKSRSGPNPSSSGNRHRPADRTCGWRSLR
jgi:hypothetical protein